jgi:hypothetical protein
MHRRRVLDRAITYIGLDVHKDTIAVALAEAGGCREGGAGSDGARRWAASHGLMITPRAPWRAPFPPVGFVRPREPALVTVRPPAAPGAKTGVIWPRAQASTYWCIDCSSTRPHSSSGGLD